MGFPSFTGTATSSGSSGRRWVVAWLSIGCAIAIVLLANAVRDYTFVSHLLATQQVRRQMTQIAAQVEQQLRRNELTADTLQTALASTVTGEEAIDLRTSDGVLLQHLGGSFPEGAFTVEEVHGALQRREPLYRNLSTPKGELVVEAFPMRAFRRPDGGRPDGGRPDGGQPGGGRPDGGRIDGGRPDGGSQGGGLPGGGGPGGVGGGPGGGGLMLLEVALPLKDADAAALGSVRRDLIINVTAAVSLLVTVLLAGVGLRSYARGRRLEEQMEIARQVQAKLLPHSTLQLPGIQISTEYKPSERVGGDFYDVFPGETHGFAVLIGDVAGKGIPAALLMGVIHGAVRTALWQSGAEVHEAESIRLNRLLCEHASGNRFASMFWCVYDESRGSLRYVNAGHCPPFLIGKRDGKLVIMRLDKGGPVFGLLPDAPYEATTVEIAAGDLLMMYSDGLVEAANAAGEEFGEGRLARLLQGRSEETPAQLRDGIMSELASFAGKSELRDDLTFAIVRFGAEAVGAAHNADALRDSLSVVQ